MKKDQKFLLFLYYFLNVFIYIYESPQLQSPPLSMCCIIIVSKNKNNVHFIFTQSNINYYSTCIQIRGAPSILHNSPQLQSSETFLLATPTFHSVPLIISSCISLNYLQCFLSKLLPTLTCYLDNWWRWGIHDLSSHLQEYYPSEWQSSKVALWWYDRKTFSHCWTTPVIYADVEM